MNADENQSFIDGIEFAIDYGLEISDEDYEEYCRLVEGKHDEGN